ncbi:LysE family translocator [Kutzneria viridogrisea]|uniref:RhtB family transporter n=1 Tax=Kutzneria albida DSM 43870 TaxID=1449976 RepID=W5WG88_9PSEU|nr:hypothetical protein KALB_6840 [Kutzneria albida DSM 43870]
MFLGATAVFAVLPGPGVLYVLARSLRGGRGEGIRSAVGTCLGALVHVVAAAFGLSAVLATSATAFTAVKLAGAAYLVYLGLRGLFGRHEQTGPDRAPRGSALVQGVLTEVLNPKTALFFLAFLPHFVHPERAPAPLVFLLLGLVVVGSALVADLTVALCAGPLGERLMGNLRWQNRQRVATSLTMIGLGGALALADNG